MTFSKKINLAMIVAIPLLFLGIAGILNTFAQTETNNNTIMTN
ncbi:MAG TPA: hypothetical protein VFP49_01145 [Nitrososphaeraceae archaeon]|jgi:hypothetical protein|nr:hypothetical protein [Nitrososphaeraceae archaeon]